MRTEHTVYVNTHCTRKLWKDFKKGKKNCVPLCRTKRNQLNQLQIALLVSTRRSVKQKLRKAPPRFLRRLGQFFTTFSSPRMFTLSNDTQMQVVCLAGSERARGAEINSHKLVQFIINDTYHYLSLAWPGAGAHRCSNGLCLEEAY